MGISWIGPVALTLYDPQLSWSAEVVAGTLARGLRGATITGETTWQAVHQLSELVDNPERRITVSTHSGILEYMYTDDVFLAPYRGWYLLEAINLRADQKHSILGVGTTDGLVGFDLKAAYIGDRQVVVARSARARTTDYPAVPQALVSVPFYDEVATGGSFEVPVAGATQAAREYDPTSPYATAAVTPPATRRMSFFTAPITVAGDAMPPLALPVLEAPPDRIPGWVANRGGEVRAYDRYQGREVFGPTHPFRTMSDIVLTNGLLRVWCGGRLLNPYLQVSALIGGSWREVGDVALASYGSADVLVGARLLSVTPDRATLALSCRNSGDQIVTLRRGERMIRVQAGTVRTPTVVASRSITWWGLPPATDLTGVSSAANGIQVAAGGRALFPWPPTVTPAAFTVRMTWLPTASSAAEANSGLMALLTSAGVEVSTVNWNAGARTISWAQAAGTLTSPALTFNANDPVVIVCRFSGTGGRSLSVMAPTGGVQTVTDPSQLGSGTTETTYADIMVGATGTAPTSGAFGSSAFGVGPFGAPGLSGGVGLNGAAAKLMIFGDYLSDAEVTALITAGSPLGALPAPESRLVWYAPFDPRPVPAGSALTSGVEFEATVEGGTVANPDANGLTKGLAALRVTASKTAGLGLSANAVSVDWAAFLATAATADTYLDQQAQFFAASEQEVRVR